ncbi:MAG: CapA family protein, partial [Rhizobacter sp.]|nr:CapA family protein [Chlorobiales bacterium]
MVKPQPVRITIGAVGDLMCHVPQLEAAKQPDGSYAFDSVFTDIAPLIAAPDFMIGNLETVLAGEKANGYTGYPNFNTPDTYAAAMQRTGFDVLTTANNHSFDRDEPGVLRTLDVLDSLKIPHTGTARTAAARDSLLIVDVKGIRLGILAYTYGINGNRLPKTKEYLINFIDTALVKKDVERMNLLPAAQRPDKIIACIHWGREYKPQPDEAQRILAGQLFTLGVDIIFGAHPHVIQPAERKIVVRGNALALCFIIYSMGNFVSAQRTKPRDTGAMVFIGLEKNFETGTTSITETSFIPTYVHLSKENQKPKFQVLPVPQTISKLATQPALLPEKVKLR